MKISGVICVLFWCALVLNGSAETLYVWTNSPSPSAPYNAWTNAAHDIQTAVNAATAGDLVLATNGIYSLNASLNLNKAVTLRSVNGAESAVIARSGVSSHRVIYMTANAVIDGFTVTNGNLNADGAGIYMTTGSVINCRITGNNNYAGWYKGGGIYMTGGVVSNCVIDGNKCKHFGGGVYMTHGLLTHCSIVGNTSLANGGGVTSYNEALMEFCILYDNVADGHGGGVVCNGIAHNCLIFHNSTRLFGGGVFIDVGSMQNCTVVGNSSETLGGGVSSGGTDDKSVINTIIYHNTAPIGNDYCLRTDPGDLDADFTNCCASQVLPGSGNITNDPLLADMDATNFHLLVNSPAIDAGVNISWMTDALDYDGGPRIVNQIVDMGAYEFSSRPIMVPYPYRDLFCYGTKNLEWTLSVADTNDTRITLALTANGSTTLLVTNEVGIRAYSWDTTQTPNGRYELKFILRNAAGELVDETARNAVVNNTPIWHSGTVTGSEVWATGVVHAVEGTLVIATNADVTIPPGAVVKVLARGGFTIESGATLNLLVSGDLVPVITSIKDDSIGSDDNQDGALSIPLPGDWQGISVATGGTLYDEGAEFRYLLNAVNGELAGNTTWKKNTLVMVSDDVTVPTGGRLTIEPGAVVKFAANKGIIVQSGGELLAQGTLAQPITFTSAKDDSIGGDSNEDDDDTLPGPGDWGMILIQGTGVMEHVVLRYGGGNNAGVWNDTAMVKVIGAGASLYLNACRLSYALYDAVSTWSGSTGLVQNCAIYWNDRGVLVREGSACTVRSCTLYANRWGHCPHGGASYIYNNIISRNTEYGIYNCCGGSWRIQYNDVWGSGTANYLSTPSATNKNISVDPRFKNPSNEVFQLSYVSPAIDAADGTRVPDRDYMNNTRYTDPRTTPTGIACTNGQYADMGAFEFVENAQSAIDLVAESVSGPVSAAAGDQVTVTWYVRNNGTETAAGSRHDAVILSPVQPGRCDTETEVTQVVVTNAIGPGQSVVFSATVRVPGGTEGPWCWSVHANRLGELFEGQNANNNRSAPSDPMTLSVTSLTQDVAATGLYSAEGVPLGFKVIQTPGTNLVITLDSAATNGSCVLYVGAGYMPSESCYDGRSAALNSPDARIQISAASSTQTLYVLVMPERLSDVQKGYSILADAAAFSLDQITPAQAGNAGPCTLAMIGGAFESDVRAFLRPVGGGLDREASSVDQEDSTLLYAAFDLQAAVPGVYHAVVSQGAQERVLSNAFTVASGGKGGELRTRILVPDRVRSGREFTGYVEYENVGDGNLTAPWLYLKSESGTSLLWEPGKSTQTANGLRFLAAAQTGPKASVLRPGVVYRFEFRAIITGTSQAKFRLYTLTGADEATMDFSLLESTVTPQHTHPLWSNAWANVEAMAGTTQGDYINMLLAAADRARAFGLNLTSEQDLLEFLVAEQFEVVQDANVCGTVYLGDTNTPLERAVLTLTPVYEESATGTVFATFSWYDGTFGFRDVTAGSYYLSAEGFDPPYLLHVEVTNPAQALTGLVALADAPFSTISGYAYSDQVGGTVVSGATIWAMCRGVRDTQGAKTDSNGYYCIVNVSAGSYTLLAEAPGRQPLPYEAVELDGGTDYQYSPVFNACGGTLRGVVLNESSNAVAQAVVRADWNGTNNVYGIWRGSSVTTDVNGAFSVNVPSGDYNLFAAAAGYGESAAYPAVCVAGQTGAVTTLIMSDPLTLTGRVVTADTGTPLTNALITLNLWQSQTSSIPTDASGFFTVNGLGARTYLVSVSAPGFMRREVEADMTGGSVQIPDVALSRFAVITGRVESAGVPVNGVPVALLMHLAEYQIPVLTDADGGYSFTAVPTGEYSLVVGAIDGSSAGRVELSVSATQSVYAVTNAVDMLAVTGCVLAAGGAAAPTNTRVLLLRDGLALDDQKLTAAGTFCFWLYEPGDYQLTAYSSNALYPVVSVAAVSNGVTYSAMLTGGSPSLSVQVKDALDAPVVGTGISLYPEGGIRIPLLEKASLADSNGWFTMPVLSTGNHVLVVGAPGCLSSAQVFSVVSGSNSVTVTLQPGCVVSGCVQSAESSNRLHSVWLDLCDTTGVVVSAVTDTNGYYAISNAPSGVFSLTVAPFWDHAAVIQTGVVLNAGTPLTLDLTVPLACTSQVAGAVVDSEGHRVTGANVYLRTMQGTTVNSARSDNEGLFALNNWTTGAWVLAVSAPGYGVGVTSIVLSADTPVSGLILDVPGPYAAYWPEDATVSGLRSKAFAKGGEVSMPPSTAMDGVFDAAGTYLGNFLGMCGDVMTGDLGVPTSPAETRFNGLPNDFQNDFADPMAAARDSDRVCSGVLEAFDEGMNWNDNMRTAYDGWYSSWNSIRKNNGADVGMYLTKSGLLAAKGVKLAMSISGLASKIPGMESLEMQTMDNIPIPTDLQDPLAGAADDIFGTATLFTDSASTGEAISSDDATIQGMKDGLSAIKVVDGSIVSGLKADIAMQKTAIKSVEQLVKQNPGKFANLVENNFKPSLNRMVDRLDSFQGSKLRNGSMLGADVLNTAYDAYSLACEYLELKKELDAFPDEVKNRAQEYLNSQDQYLQCEKNYQAAKNKLAAAIANCKDSNSAKPKTPNSSSLKNPKKINEKTSNIPASRDPNDKLTTGVGEGGYMLNTDRIYYTIRFENVATSTAPAQIVTVTDTLTADLDWSTVQIGDMQFNNTLVSVPTGLTAYTAWTNVPTDANPVRARGQFNVTNGVLTWTIESIDEVTQDLPEDPLLGFLPPNVTNGCGEGYVMFSVQANTNAASGTLITNVAKIVFDVNDPIWTPVAENRIDTLAPVSEMEHLRQRSPRQFRVEWSGSDAGGSGIDYYEVYVSVNSNAYELWMTTNATEAFYTGYPRTNYTFLVRATDAVGNQENKTGADAFTTVGLAVKNDFDGDGISDIGCYHPADGAWFVQKSQEGFWSTSYGFAGTEPISADMDGDAICDYGIYFPPSGFWSVERSTEGGWVTHFGYAGTTPVTGDFDGDGSCDFGCYFAAGGHWYIFKTADGFWSTDFGYEGTVPVTGDFDGDGIADFGCYYAPSGAWYIFKSRDGFWSTAFGYEGTVPVTGDFDGDTICDFGCYDAASGHWYIYKSRDGFWSTAFGFEGTIPVTGDYDGDVIDDFGCYHPASGTWYLFKSRDGFWSTAFGYEGTVPLK